MLFNFEHHQSFHKMTTVLIADDHPLIICGLETCLKKIMPGCFVYKASSFPDSVTRVNQKRIDLLILDLSMPGGCGLEMIATMREIQKDIKILIYSGRDELTNAPHYISKGANGYLQKNKDESEIVTAIQTVMNNQKYMSTAVQHVILGNFMDNKPLLPNPIESFNPSEREVLDLLLRGTDTTEIAKKLNMKFSTASTHKVRILKKMEVKNLVDLVAKVGRLTNHC